MRTFVFILQIIGLAFVADCGDAKPVQGPSTSNSQEDISPEMDSQRIIQDGVVSTFIVTEEEFQKELATLGPKIIDTKLPLKNYNACFKWEWQLSNGTCLERHLFWLDKASGAFVNVGKDDKGRSVIASKLKDLALGSKVLAYPHCDPREVKEHTVSLMNSDQALLRDIWSPIKDKKLLLVFSSCNHLGKVEPVQVSPPTSSSGGASPGGKQEETKKSGSPDASAP